MGVGVLAVGDHVGELLFEGVLLLLEYAEGLVVLGHADVEAGLFVVAELGVAHVHAGALHAVPVRLRDVFDALPLLVGGGLLLVQSGVGHGDQVDRLLGIGTELV